MNTQETLNSILESKADAELEANLKRLFGEIESFAYNGLHNGQMDHVSKDAVSFNGNATASVAEIWPPSIVNAARQALFEGMKRHNREKFIREFIEKVQDIQEIAS